MKANEGSFLIPERPVSPARCRSGLRNDPLTIRAAQSSELLRETRDHLSLPDSRRHSQKITISDTVIATQGQSLSSIKNSAWSGKHALLTITFAVIFILSSFLAHFVLSRSPQLLDAAAGRYVRLYHSV